MWVRAKRMLPWWYSMFLLPVKVMNKNYPINNTKFDDSKFIVWQQVPWCEDKVKVGLKGLG